MKSKIHPSKVWTIGKTKSHLTTSLVSLKERLDNKHHGAAFYVSLKFGAISERGAQVTDELDELITLQGVLRDGMSLLVWWDEKKIVRF
eukprot:8614356-Ditylum_brightwellii.AAC.1